MNNIQRNNYNYRLGHDFGVYSTSVHNVLNQILNRSIPYFIKQCNLGIASEHEFNSIKSFFKYTEDYLYYLHNEPNFQNILNSISTINAISVLPNNSRGVFGLTETSSNTVLVNPNLPGSATLTSEERTRLYVAHELGHVVNNSWKPPITHYVNQQFRAGSLTRKEAEHILNNGFSLLDEVITQNIAEQFTYDFSRKNRPVFRNFRNFRIFSGAPYKTNFDFYGEMQAPAIAFARTLRGIGAIENDYSALNTLSKRALSPNFASNIITEYNLDGHLSSLNQLLILMGDLNEASYALFGLGNASKLSTSTITLNRFSNLANSLRDIRPPRTTPSSQTAPQGR